MSFQFDSVMPKRSQQLQHMMFSSVYSVCFFDWPALVFTHVLGEFNLLFEQKVNFAKTEILSLHFCASMTLRAQPAKLANQRSLSFPDKNGLHVLRLIL